MSPDEQAGPVSLGPSSRPDGRAESSAGPNPPSPLRHPIRALRFLVRSLVESHTTPARLAAAVVVGAIIGATPFFGLHLWICLGVAGLLRLNPTATYAAANISLPPLVPLLGYASVQVGERLLHARWLPYTKHEFRLLLDAPGGLKAAAGRFFVDWLVGGVFVGAGLGVLMAGAVYVAARRRAARRARAALDEAATMLDGADAQNGMADAYDLEGAPSGALLDEAVRAASRLYRGTAPKLRWYAHFKYRMDPCYRRIARLVPAGALVVDLGTGLGMLPVLLGVLPGGRRALGLDWDGEKLQAGRHAAAGLAGVELREGDARSTELPPCDVVTLVDVLHYYEAAEQRAILERAAAALRPGGLLLVREGDARRRGGAGFTRAVEELAVRIGWNRGDGRTKFRAADSLASELESLGLRVRVEPLAARTHPGNVLLRAEKQP